MNDSGDVEKEIWPFPSLRVGNSIHKWVTSTRLRSRHVYDRLTWIPATLELKKSFANMHYGGHALILIYYIPIQGCTVEQQELFSI